MTEAIQYLIIFFVVAVVGLVGSILKRKLNLDVESEEKIKSILETIRFIVNEFNIEQRDDVILAIEKTYEALDLVNKFYEVDNLRDKKEIVMAKALSVCIELDIDLEKDDYLIVEIVDRVTDYMIGEEYLEEVGIIA